MTKGKGYRYPQEFKEQIYELHKAGQSVPKLSSEYGIPTGTIYKWISELKPFTTTEEGAKISTRVRKNLRGAHDIARWLTNQYNNGGVL